MSVALDRCETALKALVDGGSVDGAMVVRRDGISALTIGRAVDHDVLGAMAAAAAGAADVCMQTIGSGTVDVMEMRTDGPCISIAVLDQEYILVAIANSPGDLETASQALRQARTAVVAGLTEA